MVPADWKALPKGFNIGGPLGSWQVMQLKTLPFGTKPTNVGRAKDGEAVKAHANPQVIWRITLVFIAC